VRGEDFYFFNGTGRMELTGLTYLATPYSKYPNGIDVAFRDACMLAANLISLGMKVYSPIAHTHPIAIYGSVDPFDHAIWLPLDFAIMDRCDNLLVAHMSGWEDSYGIGEEIKYFTKAGKEIYDLDVDTFEITKRGTDG
jgi:Domain of unknown function (DUF1937)